MTDPIFTEFSFGRGWLEDKIEVKEPITLHRSWPTRKGVHDEPGSLRISGGGPMLHPTKELKNRLDHQLFRKFPDATPADIHRTAWLIGVKLLLLGHGIQDPNAETFLMAEQTLNNLESRRAAVELAKSICRAADTPEGRLEAQETLTAMADKFQTTDSVTSDRIRGLIVRLREEDKWS